MRMNNGKYLVCKMVGIVLLLHLFTFLPLSAQTFTQQVQKNKTGEGTVTIHQDKAIDELVNAPVVVPAKKTVNKTVTTPKTTQKENTPKTPQAVTTPKTPQKENTQKENTQKENTQKENAQKENAQKTTAKTNEATPATATTNVQEKDSTINTFIPTPPRRMRKVTGYRVQAFAGGNTRADRQQAEQTANALRSLFPGEQIESHFYNPRWLCRVGNYTTYEEARRMLTEIRRLGYSSATIVKGKISVPY